MKPIRQPSKSVVQGFTILESLIVVVVIGLAAAASTSMFGVALRGLQDTTQVNDAQRAIEENKVRIDEYARSYTCCSGICTTTAPTTYGATSSCFTNNPNDDRYYFPQLDDLSTTASEPVAIDQLCANDKNTQFMTPLKTTIDALPQPSPAIRDSAVILGYKMLRVDFKQTGSDVVVRSLYVKPRMANFCS